MTDARLAHVAGGHATAPESAEGHPAPARGRVSLSALWFGLVAAPAAWSVQTLVNLSLAAHSCFPRLTPLASPAVDGLRGITFAVGLGSLAICVAALAVAWRSWWHTREEHQGGSGYQLEHDPGSAALETGEGRTRFMALAGLLTSVTFLVVSAVNTAAIFLVSPCGR